ncbi:MAG: bifunctional pyr operon transcriptional regulator/uracil phosphoribosyltransferase PyrR [Bacteroidetes bacterium]|nr:bifunctional pyr operon transcriptional regulator/uracil phosphoribosyltransferase PyrR [Bacteroidota bacterium]
MQKRLILDSRLLEITISRLCQQLIENHGDFSDSVILGLQPRGVLLAERIKLNLESTLGRAIDLGYLDTTFHRDDFRRREVPKKANQTKIHFLIEDKNVVLVDDVLFTGRSIRSALDAILAFGRPRKVELLVLVDRKYSRHLPIEPNYVGKSVDTMDSQMVLVEWEGKEAKNNRIWLINKE